MSQDRSLFYTEAIDRGAPGAVLVASRWHLLKNVSDAVCKILQQVSAVIQKQLEAGSEPAQQHWWAAELSEKERPLTHAELRRKELIVQAQEYHDQGWTQKTSPTNSLSLQRQFAALAICR